jgi:hypothetical protein
MWVKAREREKNKEKHVNGAMFLTQSHVSVFPCYPPLWATKGTVLILKTLDYTPP